MTNNKGKVVEQKEGQFFKLHKELFEGDLNSLNLHSKVLYSLLLDRHKLSIKNDWIDDNGNAYIFYSRENMGDKLGCTRKTAAKYLKELVDAKLVKEVAQGISKPNIIYVSLLNTWIGKSYTSGGVNCTHQEG